jgi:hypothetical protein
LTRLTDPISWKAERMRKLFWSACQACQLVIREGHVTAASRPNPGRFSTLYIARSQDDNYALVYTTNFKKDYSRSLFSMAFAPVFLQGGGRRETAVIGFPLLSQGTAADGKRRSRKKLGPNRQQIDNVTKRPACPSGSARASRIHCHPSATRSAGASV